MRLTIAERLRPFSHKPGTEVILPGAGIPLQIFPTLIRHPEGEIPIDHSGPVNDFTVQLDLEKGCVHVWGKSLRLLLSSDSSGKVAIDQQLYQPPKTDRLSLGMHKAQNWEQVKRRGDLREIFPHWLRLGQMVPQHPVDTSAGTPALLNPCREAIENNDKLAIHDAFLNLFHAGFSGILSPRLADEEYQGYNISLPGPDFRGSPLTLLTEGAKLIRTLFVTIVDHNIEILPVLPPQFHSGRMVDIQCGPYGTLDIEWTKKTIRRMVFHAAAENELHFTFQKGIKSFRLNKKEKVRFNAPVTLEAGKAYLFDRFEK